MTTGKWLGIFVSVLATSLLGLWAVPGLTSLPSGEASRSLITCGKLLGLDEVRIRTLLAHGSFQGATASDLREVLESAGCRVHLVPSTDVRDGLSNVALPALTSLAGLPGWFVIGGWSEGDRSACLIAEDGSTSWRTWSELLPRLPDEILSVTNPQRRTSDGTIWIPGGGMDLGLVDGSQPNIKEVTFFNVGSRPLTIRNQRFSCGCTRASLPASSIEPGSFCRMKVTIDVSKMDVDKLDLKWLVVTDNPSAGMSIPVSASIGKPTRFSPDFFTLGNISSTAPVREVETKLVVSQFESGQFTVTPVHLEPGFKVQAIETNGRDTTLRLLVHSLEADRDKSGFFRAAGIFAVTNSNGGRELFEIGATGRLRHAIQPSPSIVNVGAVHPGQAVKRRVRFTSDVTGPPVISAVNPEFVSARVDGSAIDLDITAPTLVGAFRTGVLLRVGQESVNIPIVGVVKGTRQQERSETTTPTTTKVAPAAD